MGCTRWGRNRKWLYISPFDASDCARLGLFPSPDGIAGMYQSLPITFRYSTFYSHIKKVQSSSPAASFHIHPVQSFFSWQLGSTLLGSRGLSGLHLGWGFSFSSFMPNVVA